MFHLKCLAIGLSIFGVVGVLLFLSVAFTKLFVDTFLVVALMYVSYTLGKALLNSKEEIK